MTTKEFIARIADGTYSKNDVIMQSEQFPDKEDLLWDLELADKACLESTGKPQITDEVQINRIAKAISILSEEYRITLVNTDSHRVATSINIPGELDTDLFRAFLNVAIQRGVIEINNNTIKFNRSNALLAFACGVIFCGDYIEKDTLTKENFIKRGHNNFFPQQLLSQFFGIKRLSQSRNQIIGKYPTGCNEIQEILNKSEEITKRG
jgi:hypothetical protein